MNKERIWNIDKHGYVHRLPMKYDDFVALDKRRRRRMFQNNVLAFLIGIAIPLLVGLVK